MEHKGKNRTKGNPNFHKQQLLFFLFTILCFIESRKEALRSKRRFVTVLFQLTLLASFDFYSAGG